MMNPIILIPAHNRRATTLACLAHLQSLGVQSWASVVVVDDGSSDGTGAAIAAEFPACTVLRGNGALWWGGAINLGMRHAMDEGAESVIWLNDDCLPRAGALEALAAVSLKRQALTVGPCLLRETGSLHYGGLRRTRSGVAMVGCLPGEIQACDSICGNCVCVPRSVIERIGLIDTAAFPHFAGDADYGFRARAAGIECLVVGDAVCDSSYGSGKNRQSWLLGEMTVRELWGICFHPMNGTLARPGFLFKTRHWGWRGWAAYALTFGRLLAVSGIRALIPRALLISLFGRNHATHQHIEAVKRWEAAQARQS